MASKCLAAGKRALPRPPGESTSPEGREERRKEPSKRWPEPGPPRFMTDHRHWSSYTEARSPHFRRVLGTCKSDLVAERRTIPRMKTVVTERSIVLHFVNMYCETMCNLRVNL